MEFRAYGFLTESVATDQDRNSGVIACVLAPECWAQMIAAFILKLFSAGGAFVSLHPAE